MNYLELEKDAVLILEVEPGPLFPRGMRIILTSQEILLSEHGEIKTLWGQSTPSWNSVYVYYNTDWRDTLLHECMHAYCSQHFGAAYFDQLPEGEPRHCGVVGAMTLFIRYYIYEVLSRVESFERGTAPFDVRKLEIWG